ncbi:MAG: HAD family hydrolase [Chlamydiae bacterium]|nr:HAD family hydrolase [Chlamydiota bacterium]
MLIIFDLDDTLIDTSNCIVPIMLKKALGKMISEGLKVNNFEEALAKLLDINKFSEHSYDAIKTFLEDEKMESLYDIGVQAVYSDIPDEIEILPLRGAKTLLKELSNKYKLAVVTKGREANQLKKLKKSGLDTSFFSKIMVTEGDKGACYQKIIDEFKILAERVIVCGDRIQNDLEPAKKIGCITIHMKRARGALLTKDENVDFTIKSLMGMKKILQKVLNDN